MKIGRGTKMVQLFETACSNSLVYTEDAFSNFVFCTVLYHFEERGQPQEGQLCLWAHAALRQGWFVQYIA